MKRIASDLSVEGFNPSALGSHAAGRTQAVALAYEAHAIAPKILAKGEGVVAEAILARAKEKGIPLRAEPELVSMLMQLELDDYIPPALYAAVAELLVWAYQIEAEGY
jgi:flagellar biosynthesis protein